MDRTDRQLVTPFTPVKPRKYSIPLMRCDFPIVYGLKTTYSICTDRTDRQPVTPSTPVKPRIYSKSP